MKKGKKIVIQCSISSSEIVESVLQSMGPEEAFELIKKIELAYENGELLEKCAKYFHDELKKQ